MSTYITVTGMVTKQPHYVKKAAVSAVGIAVREKTLWNRVDEMLGTEYVQASTTYITVDTIDYYITESYDEVVKLLK